MYVGYIEFPKRMYHRELDCVTVQNPEEQEALGEGWKESPAAFEKPVEVKGEAEATEKKKRGGKAKE